MTRAIVLKNSMLSISMVLSLPVSPRSMYTPPPFSCIGHVCSDPDKTYDGVVLAECVVFKMLH